MSISLRDARSRAADREWIAAVYRDYLDDLLPGAGHAPPALREAGFTEFDQVAQWFADRGATILTILRDLRPVGFALVGTGPAPGSRRPADYRMSEFFVARAERRRGIGVRAVRLIFDRFNGDWEVVEYQRNPGAVSFWRKVIGLYTGGRYEERVQDGQVRQRFRSQPRAAAVAAPQRN